MIVRIGDICTSFSGFTPAASDLFPSGKYPYFKVAEMNREANQRVLTDTNAYVKDSRKFFPKGAIVFPKNGAAIATNKKRILGQDSIVDLNTAGVKPNTDIIGTEYLFYLFQNIDFAQYMRRGAVPTLDFKSILALEIDLPSLADQQRIVAELDLLSGIVEKKNAQLRTLDELASTIFYEMFGDPVSNDRNWPTARMNDVAPQKVYAGAISAKDGKYWLLNLDMVESQTGRVVEKALFSPAEIRNSTTTFNEDNVLYSKLRPYLNKVVLPDEPGYCTSELVPLLPKKGVLNRIYLTYLLRSKFFVDYINARVAGAKMPRVTMSDFREFDVILPPIAFQESFAARIIAIDKQKKIINDSIPPAKDLLLSRMDKYFC